MIEQIYKLYSQKYRVTTDSRKIDDGSVFFALKGEHFDGNDFAYQVANDNIAACVVADRKDLPYHERLFIVDDSLTALQQLAKMHRERCGIPVIAITGTNGKTTTKELIAAVLSKKYNIIYTQGNFNNHLGLPLTLLQIRPETEIAVVEMGANHPGEIAQLCSIAQPDFGIITNIGKAHIEGFGSFEGVVKTKNELYQYLKTKDERRKTKVFVNGDNDLLMQLSEGMDRIVYEAKDERLNIKTKLVGEYNYENVMAAITIGRHFKVEDELIIEALENYCPTNNRSQYIKTDKNEIVMDAYNANPTSMSHSIKNFRNISGDEHLLILGDMRELGHESAEEHHKIIMLLKELDFKNVMLVGEEFKKVNDSYDSYTDIDKLIEHIKENDISGCKILVKGSRGVRLEKVINLL